MSTDAPHAVTDGHAHDGDSPDQAFGPINDGGRSRRNDGRDHEIQRDPETPTNEDGTGRGARRDGRDNEIASDPPTQPTSEEDPDRRSQRDKRRPPTPTNESGRGRDGRDNEITSDPPVQTDALAELFEDAYWQAPEARADRAGRLGGIQALPEEAEDVLTGLSHRAQPTA